MSNWDIANVCYKKLFKLVHFGPYCILKRFPTATGKEEKREGSANGAALPHSICFII